jgi:hypothetical protein
MALFIRWSDWQRHIQAWETWGRLHPDVSGGCGASSAAALTAVTIAFLLLGPPFVLAQRPQPQITPRCLRSLFEHPAGSSRDTARRQQPSGFLPVQHSARSRRHSSAALLNFLWVDLGGVVFHVVPLAS